jgi:hypothetical protein
LLTSQEEPSAHLIAKLIVVTNLPFERLFKIMHPSAALTARALSSSRVAPLPALAGAASEELGPDRV